MELTDPLIEIPAGKVCETYITIEVVTERGDKRAVFQIDCLCHRDIGNYITLDNVEVIAKKDDIGCSFTVEGWPTPQYTGLWVKAYGPQGVPLYWSWILETRIRENRPEESPGDVGFHPRLQMSIVGMRDAKKLSWAGLSDGVNWMLVPTFYTTHEDAFVYNMEGWAFSRTKQIGTVSVMDRLNFSANCRGTGTAWTYGLSRMRLTWITCSGDYGVGSPVTSNPSIIYSAGCTGFFKNRLLANQVTINPVGGGAVTFLWGRYDPERWMGYPVGGPVF
jgi:hypothetical protein